MHILKLCIQLEGNKMSEITLEQANTINEATHTETKIVITHHLA